MKKSDNYRERSSWCNPIVIGLLVLGLLVRVAFVVLNGLRISYGEAPNVAMTFARTGVLGDPFVPGTGPTAHVTPLPPLFAGMVYRLLGVRTPAAESVLLMWALVLTLSSFYFCYRAFLAGGMRQRFALLGLAVLCILPLNINLETVWFRTWDGGMAVALGFLTLWLLLAADRKGDVTTFDLVKIVIAAGLTLFVSPPLGVATYAAGGVLFIRHIPWRRWPSGIGIVAAITVAVLAPWTLRNLSQFGQPIVFRDNMGLELAQAFYPGALDITHERRNFQIRHETIHPFENPPVAARMMREGGEAVYADRLGAEAKGWIRAHPAEAIRIAARHVRDILFPPAWYWTQFTEHERGTLPKLVVFWLITFAGLLELGWGLLARSRTHVTFAIMVIVPLLPYVLVQPTLRYRYIVFAPLVFLSAFLLQRLWRMVPDRRSSAAHPVMTPRDARPEVLR